MQRLATRLKEFVSFMAYRGADSVTIANPVNFGRAFFGNCPDPEGRARVAGLARAAGSHVPQTLSETDSGNFFVKRHWCTCLPKDAAGEKFGSTGQE